MKAAGIVLCALVVCAAASGTTLPSATQLEVRLTSRVASNASKAQDAVSAVVIAPVVMGGEIVLPAGVAVKGVVKQAVPIKTPQDRAALELEFTSLAPETAPAIPIEAKVVGVDNAREKVNAGRIDGILASETISSRLESGVEKVTEKHSGFGGFLETMKTAVLKEPEPEIVYEPGVEMTLELAKPAEVKTKLPVPQLAAVTPEEALYRFVNAQPFQTKTEGQGIPSDMTNVMFIASEEQLKAAFTAAGWSTAAQLNSMSGLETFRAIAEMRGYKEAPMSVLILDGQKPSVVFQKQNNTFAMRHHLRIWRRPDTFEGSTVWVCAATHDIGIEFSPEKRNFIHKIDSEIDRERAKVVNDLLFGGHLKALSIVDRPQTPRHSMNATGDKLETDGRMAVVLLQ